MPAYSNYGYALTGHVVERVSGTPFDEHVGRTVLARARMTSSGFAQPLPPELRSRLSHGYATDSGPAGPFETVGPAPAGALAASATDMGRFILASLGEAGPERSLLRPGTAALMRQPALDSTSLGSLADGPRMALGLFDESRNGHRIVGHGGDTRYFHSHLQIYPDDRTGVFVTLNSTGRGATDTLDLRQSLLDGFADRYFPATAQDPTPRTATATSHAVMAAGTYENARAPFSTFLSALTVTGTARDAGVAVPVLLASAAVLLISMLAWPIGAIVRRRHSLPPPAPLGRVGRTARILTWIAAAAGVLALAGWAAAIVTTSGLQDLPASLIHGLQAAQWVALAGVIPAAVGLVVAVRRRAGRAAVLGSVLLLLALGGISWFALVFGLLSPAVSY